MKLGIENRSKASLESQNDLGYLTGFHSRGEIENQIRSGPKDVLDYGRRPDTTMNEAAKRE